MRRLYIPSEQSMNHIYLYVIDIPDGIVQVDVPV